MWTREAFSRSMLVVSSVLLVMASDGGSPWTFLVLALLVFNVVRLAAFVLIGGARLADDDGSLS